MNLHTLSKLFPRKKIIYGCESREDAQSPYLTRWTLLDTKRGRLYLHLFHRSDADIFHDHPWRFWTLVLWRGYEEVVQERQLVSCQGSLPEAEYHQFTRRIRPGTILFRPATHTHRVQLWRDGQGKEKPAVTLVWSSSPERHWGFAEGATWTPWREYFRKMGC